MEGKKEEMEAKERQRVEMERVGLGVEEEGGKKEKRSIEGTGYGTGGDGRRSEKSSRIRTGKVQEDKENLVGTRGGWKLHGGGKDGEGGRRKSAEGKEGRDLVEVGGQGGGGPDVPGEERQMAGVELGKGRGSRQKREERRREWVRKRKAGKEQVK